MIAMVVAAVALPLCYANVGERVAFVTNKNPSKISQLKLFKNPFGNAPELEPLTAEEKSQMVLDDLGMESSTEPRVFYTDPKRAVDIATAFMPFILRLGSGSFAEGHKLNIIPIDESKYTFSTITDKYQIEETCALDAPPTFNRGPIVLYEFEACPFCRKVRESVSILSLEVEFRPCPQGSRFRKEIKEEFGNKATFPFMRDPNTGVEMFESDDIIKYLFNTYGKDGTVPSSLEGNIVNTLTAGLGLLLRSGRGSKIRSSDPPEQPLTLWSGEGSPYAKLVKEELCELQIAHVQIGCPRGSVQRQRMFEKTGRFQIPYLEDPNTGASLYESSAIIEYLDKMYGVKISPVPFM